MHREQKKGDKLSSNEYDKDITFQQKNRRSTPPNITPPAMMEVCEVRDKCTDTTSTVVMEDFLNKNLDEIQRDMTENETETNWDTLNKVIK